MKKTIKGILAKPVSLVVAVVVPLLIVGWHLASSSKKTTYSIGTTNVGKLAETEANGKNPNSISKKSDLENIAKEVGSIGKFIGAPVPNSAGTKILFEETVETGVGMFFCETPNGHRQLLYEQPEKNYHVHDIHFLGWSPDDKYFAYCRKTDKREVVICDGESGQTVTTIPVSQTIYSGMWLSSQDFVYLDRNQTLREIRQLRGQWQRPNRFKSFKNVPEEKSTDAQDEPGSVGAPLKNLTAIAESVVWQQGGTIWGCSYNANAPVKIWESTTNELLEFSYSQRDQAFLMHCKDAKGEFLASYIPGKGQFPARFSELTRISTLPATNVTCINGLKGYVYLTKNDTGHNTFLIKKDDSSKPFLQSWSSIKSFTVTDNQLFVIGARSFTNDLVGIWQYSFAANSLTCAVPNQESSFKYAKFDATPPIIITNSFGEKRSYKLKSPADFSSSKKYPVVIGEGWSGYQLAVANGGDYFANLSREDRSVEQWKADMMAAYADVVKNPNIDTNAVYLIGISAGADVVVELLEQKPDLWHGAILFSPRTYPDASRLHVSKILIDSGSADIVLAGAGRKRLSQFQDAALHAGIPVTVAIHGDAAHVYRSVGAERERVQELVKFLFE